MGIEGENEDVIDTPEDLEEDPKADEPTGNEPEGDDPPADPPEDEPEEVVVSIGDETPPEEEESEAQAPAWVKDLRKANREKDKKIRELEKKLATSVPVPQEIKLGEKPTLESCDYDEAKFEKDLEAWHGRKRQVEEQQRKREEETKAAEAAWQAKLQGYEKSKTELKVKDFEDAEDLVKNTLSQTQQGIIVHGAKQSAVVIYALGRNPKKLQEVAKIKDPVEFAFAIANVEAQLRVQPKKSAPPPEKAVRGSGPVGGSSDATLDKLRAEAAKTGDLSKVLKYKREKKAA